MNVPALDAFLLFSLSVPVVMRYRILPVEGTPYWLFGILFLLLIINVLISLYPKALGNDTNHRRIKNLLLVAVLVIVVGGTSVTAMVDRSRTAPVYGVHDIILQQEAAMRYLLQGRNPYKETYFGTPLEQWHYAENNKEAVNPALYHFVMPPWYVLFAFPFYFVALPILGFFDGRMPLLFSLLALLVVLYQGFKDKHLASIAMILTALSPATIDYFIEGRSDIFALFWLIWALYLLERRRFIWSSIVIALAALSKQTAWFMLPMYGVYQWVLVRKSVYKTMGFFALAFTVAIVVSGPFIAWDARAFVDSVVWYLSGNSIHSYPISGYGLGMLLHELGFIKDLHAYYPFILWQTIVGMPTLLYILWWIMKRPRMSTVLIGYGMVLFVFWYMSRYFNNSHAGYLSSVLALGILKKYDE